MHPKQDEARNTAYRCLLEVLENQGYSNLVLKQELSGSSLNEKERSFVTAMVYGTVTRIYTIDYLLSRYLKKELSALDRSVRTCLRMGAWQVLFAYGVKDYAAVSSAVDLSRNVCPKGSESMVNAVLRKLASEGQETLSKIPSKKTDVRYSLKSEIAGCLNKWYGKEKAEKIMEAFLQIPEVTIRPNVYRVKKTEDLISELKKDGIEAIPDPIHPGSLDIPDNRMDISDTSAYKKGLFSVQSLSAMLVGYVASPEKGWSVLDTCSAPGGKTAHLAELMNNEGHIDALDANDIRLKMVGETAERLGLSIISTLHYDCTYLKDEKERLLPEYDLVLCDVPCSGLGLLHRKPDIRLSMTYEKMQSLMKVQESILENSCRRVKPGGYLIYSTCTINPDENENRIDAFLAAHPDFECVSFDENLPEKLLSNPRLLKQSKEGKMTILPDEEGLDGFFIAKMRRRS
ncbi:MAG: 16S rRNA (cytosine(967)-C(5))-methyltransferase RsmB [Clostridiales bacterium]|nr:16S rRNA (cytosine(967)-C(5))-methyltransferase RsmB [Clostridiales bacterium]